MARTNLIVNPSFKTNATGWSPSSALRLRITNTYRTGTTATITTASTHGLVIGQSVTISGTNGNSVLHGTYVITSVPTTTTFTYTTSASGTITSAPDTGTVYLAKSAVATATEKTITNSERSGTTAVITTSAAHLLVAGDVVTVDGTNGNPSLEGTWTVAGVPSATTFTYTTTVSGSITSAADTGTVIKDSTSAQRVTYDSFFGSSCLEVTKPALANSGAVTSSRIAVSASISYAVSAYVKVPADEETGTFRIDIDWYTAASGGSFISTSSTTAFEVVDGIDWTRLSGVFTSPANAAAALIYVLQPTAGTTSKKFLLDAVLLEANSYVEEYFDDVTQAYETTTVNKGLSKVPYPKVTGMQLNADISLGSLVLNTIDEDGVVWVCTNIEGWWTHPDPEVRDIPRGYGDGSYDVRGRYNARVITLEGVFVTPSASQVAAARDKLIKNTDLVYVGDWLRTNENPTKASYVRLSGRPEIKTVNARGRTEFSIGLRAPDPLKYEWYEAHELGYRSVTIAGESASPAASGTATVTNTGTAYTSVVLQVTGPVTGPATIFNETTNETITIIESLRGVLTRTVSNKALTGDIATLTTSAAHGMLAGDEIVVTGVDSTFNGTFTILTVPTTTTLTYAKTATNVSATASSGTITFGPDILEIDTREHEVALNGDAIGKRGLVDVLAEWILLAPGDNIISFYDDGNANSTAVLEVFYRSAWLG
jgi:hypothetical protein